MHYNVNDNSMSDRIYKELSNLAMRCETEGFCFLKIAIHRCITEGIQNVNDVYKWIARRYAYPCTVEEVEKQIHSSITSAWTTNISAFEKLGMASMPSGEQLIKTIASLISPSYIRQASA